MPVLNWIGKDAVVAHDAQVPFRLLHDVPELSCSVRAERSGPQGGEVEASDNSTGNLIVEGDNLLALKVCATGFAMSNASHRRFRCRLHRTGSIRIS